MIRTSVLFQMSLVLLWHWQRNVPHHCLQQSSANGTCPRSNTQIGARLHSSERRFRKG
ncbi:hypothetical protein JMJ77_0005502 [Colletotrichum scovillei]|uniref:Secreted protein n=1 Tax=Colletotrichum scovillei TaxID=1209932 RepID=A0A9P7RIE5_9PEZI|nr:hypothetical protein JMJ77_0005502 [Colletotrichum scovillei]KAG7076725.1 hypothetical protein JMJ76_0013985 [Colletotrichum scovillei]KAG7083920.1 hypothetical protein JMJ78_0009361 [Colletotrichum scovillei]